MVKALISARLEKLAGGSEFSLVRPANESFGEYATNLALVLGNEQKKNPAAVAAELVESLKSDGQLSDYLDSVTVEGPGFVNFKLKSEYYLNWLPTSAEKNYGQGEWGKGKKVLVEYSSPNIAKRFSAGHLRSTIIGDALASLYRFSGWSVVTDNHLGDWGTQFGMIIAAVEEKGLEVSGLTVAELEDLYVEFNSRLKDDPDLRDKAREAFSRLEQGDEAARKIWLQAKEVSLKEFDHIYQQLGVKFDFTLGEADYEAKMKEIIPQVKSKLARESEGALIVEFEDMPPAMLLKSNGTTTYFTRDLATVKYRLDESKLKADQYIYEVGAEQTLHFRQVFATAVMMGWATRDQFVHVAHGLMTLPEGKMSTRAGRTVKLDELLSQAKIKAAKLGSEGQEPEKIAIGALKFNELRHAPTSNYVFTWEEALNMEGESGPYLQYAYVRAHKVLEGIQAKTNLPENYDFNNEELALARQLHRFGEDIEIAAKNFAPNLVATYLFELGQRWNSFYNQHRILQAETEDQKQVRLALTLAVENVLKTGLEILGIEVVKRM
jgi:arginyl-tRNA synthetase